MLLLYTGQSLYPVPKVIRIRAVWHLTALSVCDIRARASTLSAAGIICAYAHERIYALSPLAKNMERDININVCIYEYLNVCIYEYLNIDINVFIYR